MSGMTFTSYLQTWFTLYPKTLCGLTLRKTGLRGDKNILGLGPSDVRWADGLKKIARYVYVAVHESKDSFINIYVKYIH